MRLNHTACGPVASMVTDENFYAWFAGLYEGEGSITISKPGKRGGTYLRLSMGMTDRDVLEHVQRHLGGSLSSGKPSVSPQGKLTGKTIYYWQIGATERVKDITRAIYPYLGERRRARIDELTAQQVYATPLPTKTERFESKIEHRDGHWIWTGSIDMYGFATWSYLPNKRVQGHRYAWEQAHGSVPKRLVNECGSKNCVNPDHWSAFAVAYDEA